MNRKISIIILTLLLLVSIVSALPNNKVEVIVLGMINHGPMQPTMNAIKKVTSKYGPNVTLKLIDLESEEGQKYSQKHGLTAHLNILINGKYRYNINGEKVTFQWFEGQEWTKEDLDAVVSNLLNKKGAVTPVDNQKSNNGLNLFIIFVVVSAITCAVAWFLIKKTEIVKKTEK